MADEGLCCSSALVGDVKEYVLWRVSHSVTVVPGGSLCETGGIEFFFFDAWVCEKYAPSLPVTRLLGRSGFENSVGCVEADASDNTKEITSLGGCLMQNNAAVFGGRVWLNMFWGSSLICGNTLRGSPQWCLISLWCVESIDISGHWRGYNWYRGIQRCKIIHLPNQRMPCASNRVRCSYLWTQICVNRVPVVGCSFRLILLMLGILIGGVWVSHDILTELSISMLWRCHCSLQINICSHLTIVWLFIW